MSDNDDYNALTQFVSENDTIEIIDGFDTPNYHSTPEPVRHFEPYVDRSTQTSPSLLDQFVEERRIAIEHDKLNSSCVYDDSCLCTICLDPLTADGGHRVIALKCGHVFGETCILRWMAEGNNKTARCPNCSALCKKDDLRRLYVRSIKMNDPRVINAAKRDIDNERKRKEQLTQLNKEKKAKLQSVIVESEQVKKAICDDMKEIEYLRSTKLDTIAAQNKAAIIKSRSEALSLKKSIELNVNSDCRILASSDPFGMIVISQKILNNFLNGYGVRKVNLVDFRANEFIRIHQNQIKDMCFYPNDLLMLSASLDKTLKITNLMSCSVVSMFNLDVEAWSCCWDGRDRNYVYVGLKNGKVLQYDMRNTTQPSFELVTTSRMPVTSMQYFSNHVGDERLRGVMVTHLKSCCFHQYDEQMGVYKEMVLPVNGNFISSHFDRRSSQFVISSRPMSNQPKVTHNIFSLTPKIAENGEKTVETECLSTFTGGMHADYVYRSKIFPHPNDECSSLLCAGDQDLQGCYIWDVSSRKCLQELRCASSVFDVTFMKTSNSNHLIASLTRSKLFIYQWLL